MLRPRTGETDELSPVPRHLGRALGTDQSRVLLRHPLPLTKRAVQFRIFMDYGQAWLVRKEKERLNTSFPGSTGGRFTVAWKAILSPVGMPYA